MYSSTINHIFHRQVLDTDITEAADEHKMDDSVLSLLVPAHGGSQRLRRERARRRQTATGKILLKPITQGLRFRVVIVNASPRRIIVF